jgi:hypothetical protein
MGLFTDLQAALSDISNHRFPNKVLDLLKDFGSIKKTVADGRCTGTNPPAAYTPDGACTPAAVIRFFPVNY